MATYNQKEFIVSAKSFQPLKTLALSQPPSLTKERMKKSKWLRGGWGVIKVCFTFYCHFGPFIL